MSHLTKAEGLVTGSAVKLFTIALSGAARAFLACGMVIVFGVSTGALYGLVPVPAEASE